MLLALIIACLLLGFAVVLLSLSLRNLRTEHAETLEAIRHSHEKEAEAARFERDRILNALGDAFLLIDAKGIITIGNIAARRLFDGRKLRQRPLDEVILESRFATPIREALETGTHVVRKIILPHQASPEGGSNQRGETAWLVDAAPLDRDHPREGIRVLIRDQTAEYQTEQVRQDFVANASHELRTPLAIINGYIENLLDDDLIEETEQARRFLGTMRKHGDRLARIVEDMLVISRLESGEDVALNPEPFALRGCIADVTERLEPIIQQQKATIVLNLPDPSPTIHGDRFYWTQVFFNLVENALKQNPTGPLRVEIGCETTAKGSLRLWVADDGIGIPANDLPFVFHRFFRVQKHHSQGAVKGTGLGLSIVKRAVEAHRGTIRATSTPGQETRFEITLPPEAHHPAQA
jgi:two-component system, OmpR family, phosphate regulon sensor histidine kinase PhoR